MIEIFTKSDLMYFKLNTKENTYCFRVTKYNHLESVYIGQYFSGTDFDSSLRKNTIPSGNAVRYKNDEYALDEMSLEYSSVGKGDFRNTPIELVMPSGSYVCDFTYVSHEFVKKKSNCLPLAYGEEKTLMITMKDVVHDVYLIHEYSIYEESNVITRRVILRNEDDKVQINKIMSMMIDLDQVDYEMISFDGAWLKEATRNTSQLSEGIHIISSTTGASSSRHNPGIILKKKSATEDSGFVFGFNLMYSGNHMTSIEKYNGNLRVENGINSHCFSIDLNKGESFETPEAIITFSHNGVNGVSKNFHHFVNHHVVRGDFKKKKRPILINGWEAFEFDFTEKKIYKLAKKAKKLGIEMLVMDDGWFGNRNDATEGLGDYYYNKKKFANGINPLINKINKLGLKFGLWFEPEMVNEKSELFRRHPEYVVKDLKRENSFGRDQLVLNLTMKEVRDYIVSNVNRILENNNIEYVKWDMNRHMSDMYSKILTNQGEFFHRYTLGLYEIMDRIITKNPTVLFEGCSSGGNRYDLGILSFMPQIWASDNTDPICRLDIQGGFSTLYPLSTIGAHVSMSPHQQTLRDTPLTTRYNVSCFGLLGYELELSDLTYSEKKIVSKQIEFYKENRELFQYGEFTRTFLDNRIIWQVSDGKRAIVGNFKKNMGTLPNQEVLPVKGMQAGNYKVSSVSQRLNIKMAGNLIKHLLPKYIKITNTMIHYISKLYSYEDAREVYYVNDKQLLNGIRLSHQYKGLGYNSDVRLLSEYGSTLYLVEEHLVDTDEDY